MTQHNKMNKKTITAIMLAAILITLAGCTGLNVNNTNKNTITLPAIREGTRGIEISFIQELPPAEVFEGQIFEIGFNLENKGAEDVQNGIYTLGMNEQQIIMLDEKINRFNIKGKSTFNPLGGQERIILKAQANTLGEQLGSQSTTIIANACYEYSTSATLMTCIDPQPLKKEQKTCTTSTITQSGGQGGPVAVTQVEPKLIPHTDTEKIIPSYMIQIQNTGTGQVIDTKQVYEACTGRNLGKENYDLVSVSAVLSDEILTCEPTQIRLKQSDNKILCKLDKGINKNTANYKAPLTINIEYGYMQTKPKTIRILKIPR